MPIALDPSPDAVESGKPIRATADAAAASSEHEGGATGRNSKPEEGGHLKNPPRSEETSAEDFSPSSATATATVASAVTTNPTYLELTFFHNPTTYDVRWSLSPRSALETPRTPRREAIHRETISSTAAGTSTDESYRDAEDVRADDRLGEPLGGQSGGSGSGWKLVEDGDVAFYFNRTTGISTWEPPPGWNVPAGEHGGGGMDDCAVAAVDGSVDGQRDGSGSEWERVEDGDMVFYYNKSMGMSSWEPPPGWDAPAGEHGGD